jgi:hypothetical protein
MNSLDYIPEATFNTASKEYLPNCLEEDARTSSYQNPGVGR